MKKDLPVKAGAFVKQKKCLYLLGDMIWKKTSFPLRNV